MPLSVNEHCALTQINATLNHAKRDLSNVRLERLTDEAIKLWGEILRAHELAASIVAQAAAGEPRLISTALAGSRAVLRGMELLREMGVSV